MVVCVYKWETMFKKVVSRIFAITSMNRYKFNIPQFRYTFFHKINMETKLTNVSALTVGFKGHKYDFCTAINTTNVVKK